MLDIVANFCYISVMKNIHEKFVEYGRNARKWINECKMLLPEIERQGIWREKGFVSIYEYAAKLACLSRGQVDDALRIMKKIEDKPAILKVAHEKGLNSVRPVVTIATQETQKIWATRARIMSKNALELHVRKIRTSTENQAQTIEMDLSQEVIEELKTLKGDGAWNNVMKELLEARKTLLEQEKPKKVENAGRSIPKAIEKWVIKTTNGQCYEQGCYKKYDVLHHEDYFALTKIHDPDRIKPLCKGHHELRHNYAETPDQFFINQKMLSFARAP
jgi:hypothetical protein